MPASKDPRNYEKMYHDLSILMDARQPVISIETTFANAQHIRGRFYAYVMAWKFQAEYAGRSKIMTSEEKVEKITHALHMEEILRRYMTVCDTKENSDEATLHFILRDLNPRTKSAADQISTQIDSGDILRKLALRREQDRTAIGLLRKVEGVPVKGASDYAESPIANLFAGITVEPIDLPAEELEKGSTDLTDLLPPSKECVPGQHKFDDKPGLSKCTVCGYEEGAQSTNLANEAMQAAEKLREKERKDSAK